MQRHVFFSLSNSRINVKIMISARKRDGVRCISKELLICDVTCQNQTNVEICHMPEIRFYIILEENIIFYAN